MEVHSIAVHVQSALLAVQLAVPCLPQDVPSIAIHVPSALFAV